MTQKLLLSGILLVLFQLPALAQTTQSKNPPKYCNPCLFYGGDESNTSDANGLANEEDVLVPKAEVLVPFDVPKTEQWKAIGLFTNDWSSVNVLDPAKAAWSITTNVTQGHCGPALVSGNSHATFKPTGRSAFGENEYTTLVKIKAVQLTPGRYWLTTVPECTQGSSCTAARYFVSTFVGKPLDPFGPPEPCNKYYSDSKFFGANCVRAAGKGCSRVSAGVLGTKLAGDALLDADDK
jgi:hypothetical protein